MERFVAIDNMCAWPNLTKMPDGAIVATIFNQPTHGGWEGDAECWASEDGGRLWVYRGTPAPHEPGTNRMNVAAGLARDGSLVALVSGWDKRPPKPPAAGFDDARVIPVWVCRSADDGRTWEQSDSVRLPDGPYAVVPYGDIVPLADGSLGASCYAGYPDGCHACYFYRSLDDGRSWEPVSAIRAEDGDETALLELPSGRLLAAVRTCIDQHLHLLASDDSGETWSDLGPVTLGRQIPAHLLALRDGRILLTYGIRNVGLYGVGARVSNDGGATWDVPRMVVNFTGADDGGYPSTVETDDGELVTAYYCNRVEAHTRYHMGVVRWRLDK